MNDLMKELDVSFTSNPQEELAKIAQEMQLSALAKSVQLSKDTIPEQLYKNIEELAGVLEDLFLSPIPKLDEDPAKNLRKVSRDINLARILRERGLFRFYLLVKSKTTVPIQLESGEEEQAEVNVFQTLLNPDKENASPFITQEEFIRWFTQASSVSRALVFLRLSEYNRFIKTLGYAPTEAFKLIASKPDLLRTSLEDVGTWENDVLVNIPPQVAINLANLVQQGEDRDTTISMAEEFEELLNDRDTDPIVLDTFRFNLVNHCIPLIRNVVEEMALHDSMRDASRLFKVAVLNKPRVTYYWDYMLGGLKVMADSTYLNEDGQEVVEHRITFNLLPDSFEEIPQEIVDDIISKTGAKNFNLDVI